MMSFMRDGRSVCILVSQFLEMSTLSVLEQLLHEKDNICHISHVHYSAASNAVQANMRHIEVSYR